MKQTADKKISTLLRLSEIERLIRRHRILVPPPSRPTLINFCEEGVFGNASKTKFGWLVREESFWNWVESLDASGDLK